MSNPRTPRRSALKLTDVPNVYRNKAGALTDEYGVLLSFKALRAHDKAWVAEVLDGGIITEPADLLKAVSLDPRYPMSTRLDAATKAAPYFTPKRVAVQGVAGAPPIGIAEVSKLSTKDLDKLESALATAMALMEKTK
jgi:hypothetical protein